MIKIKIKVKILHSFKNYENLEGPKPLRKIRNMIKNTETKMKI